MLLWVGKYSQPRYIGITRSAGKNNRSVNSMKEEAVRRGFLIHSLQSQFQFEQIYIRLHIILYHYQILLMQLMHFPYLLIQISGFIGKSLFFCKT